MLERWRSRAALDAFRGDGPAEEQQTALLAVEVHDHEVVETASA